ncbi:SDR family NAD(P)-dependent oxidoreductase, partial [bacterium]|nr:SDR family NAD(P)-dependent oxidoreductase [bacterium]
QINSIVPTELTYRFVEHMLSHGKPSYITQVASIAAFQPVGYFTVYSGTKGYLRYFSETLAFELRSTNIHVMCLCPGGTYTEFFEQSGQKITSAGQSAMMSAKTVVQSGIESMLSRKTVCVPGILNKLACFIPRLLPRRLALHLAFLTMNRSVEKAQIPIK